MAAVSRPVYAGQTLTTTDVSVMPDISLTATVAAALLSVSNCLLASLIFMHSSRYVYGVGLGSFSLHIWKPKIVFCD